MWHMPNDTQMVLNWFSPIEHKRTLLKVGKFPWALWFTDTRSLLSQIPKCTITTEKEMIERERERERESVSGKDSKPVM